MGLEASASGLGVRTLGLSLDSLKGSDCVILVAVSPASRSETQ